MTWLLLDERLARGMVPTLARWRVLPNAVTAVSLALGLAAVALAAAGALWLSALAFCSARFLDHVDGALARATGRTTTFGGYFDNLTGTITVGGLFWALSLEPALTTPALTALAAAILSRVLEIALSFGRHWMLYTTAAEEGGVLVNIAVDEAGWMPYWTFPLALAFGQVGLGLWLVGGVATTTMYVVWLARFRIEEAGD